MEQSNQLKTITISTENFSFHARLNQTHTAERIFEALPLEGHASIWGEEIYFHIPLELDQEPGAREDMEVGTLAYWPLGPAFCIFFGKTPASTGELPRAYSPVNVFGHISGDVGRFKTISSGAKIRVTQGLE